MPNVRSLLACPSCRNPLPEPLVRGDEFTPCPACRRPLSVDIFPALLRDDDDAAEGQALMSETEASCFFHPDRQAAQHCADCGRFLCRLCDIAVESQHLCPKCFQASLRRGTTSAFTQRLFGYDRVALRLALLAGLLSAAAFLHPVAGFALAAAPLAHAAILCVKHWRTRCSLVRSSRPRFAIAAALITVQAAAWAAVACHLITLHG